jgi:UDP-N-acetylmuramate dehydrogenase
MQPHSNERLRGYNTLALEARADAFVEVNSDADLVDALAWARDRTLPVLPLGQGSNVVFAGDVHALMVHMSTRGIEVLEQGADTVTLRIAAGESWHEFVRWSLDEGFYGLENLALIPGTVGAAPIQNIGAYGVELDSVFLRLHAMDIADGSVRVMDRAACEFGYRDSVFKRGLRDRLVITAVELQLSKRPAIDISYPSLAEFFAMAGDAEPTPRDVFAAVVAIRSTRLPDPARDPNAGSFFKNPVLTPDQMRSLATKAPGIACYPQPDGLLKVPAAWLIERCGWKGHRRGGVGVHDEHALVLVNCGGNDGGELLSLAGDVAASVHETFGLELEIEPRVYGA